MRPPLNVRQPNTAVHAPTSAEVRYETLTTNSSNASIALAATITAQAGSKNARITSPDRTGRGANQRRAKPLTDMTPDHTSKSAPNIPNMAITTMAESAVVPSGMMTRIGIVARETILGCAQAKAWRIGQLPSALKAGRNFAALLNF